MGVVVGERNEVVALPGFREDAHPTIAELRDDAHGQIFRLGFATELLVGVSVVQLGETGDAPAEEGRSIHTEVLRRNEGVAVQLVAHLGHDLMVVAVAPVAIAGHRCRGVPDPEVHLFIRVGIEHVAQALVLALGQVDVQGAFGFGRCRGWQDVRRLSEQPGREGRRKGPAGEVKRFIAGCG